jgi:hypothetical protein
MNHGPTVRTGSSGADVRRLQRLLVMMKLLNFDEIDGAFGPKTVAERHARLAAVVVELHARARGLVHADLRHRVRAQDDQLGLHELEDFVADRELAAAVAPDHGELVASADAQVDADALARGVSKCSGPYHSATSSGSVHALKTRSRGASKMRVIRTS